MKKQGFTLKIIAKAKKGEVIVRTLRGKKDKIALYVGNDGKKGE